MLALGMLGVLASVVMVAINPTKQLDEARDAERHSHVRELQSAMIQYIIDNRVRPGDKEIPEGAANALPICRRGVTNVGCINMDDLLSTYAPCIPYDGAETDNKFTGYSIHLQGGRMIVVAEHLGGGAAGGGCTP